MEVVNQASNKRMKVKNTKIVTITLDESDTNNDIEIIEHRMNQRKTGSRRIYYDKQQTSTMVLLHKTKWRRTFYKIIHETSHGNGAATSIV